MSNALDVTDSTWEAAVTNSATPVLVDFWAPWCNPCKAMSPHVDRLAEEFKGRLTVLKLNTEDNPEISNRFGITAIPTFLVLKNGETVKHILGQMAYEKLKRQVEEALG